MRYDYYQFIILALIFSFITTQNESGKKKVETLTLSNFHISHPETDVTHRPHNTDGFSERREKDWLGERAVDPRLGVGVGRTVTHDKLHNDVLKKGQGENQ